MDSDVQPAVEAFILSGTKKAHEKKPWILFDVGKKEANDKDTIRIVREGKPGESYDDLVQILLETDAAYAVADFPLEGESKKTYPIFINW